MKNVRIEYRWTNGYDKGMHNCGFVGETQYIVVEPPYEFGDWIRDHGGYYEEENGTFFIIKNEERTGEAFCIVSETETDEELIG